ncbi:hypothetical protein D1872_276450 [compost metagenome]
MNHNFAVRQRVSFARRTGIQQESAHGSREAHANRGNVGLNVLHRIENGHTGCDGAARAINVKMDVFPRIFRVQKQHLGNNGVGDDVIHLGAQENDAVLQQSRVNVVSAFAAVTLFNDHRNITHR